LLNTRGWDEREKEGKGEERWVMGRREWRVDEDGKGGGEYVVREKIPLPENFRLGLEQKGMDVNHSGRANNGFGKTGKPLFPGEGRGEGRNWIATFNSAGCMGCKKGGVSVHKGRTGAPVILIVGYEAVPMTVGVTKKGGEEVCMWVLKKEHLGLNEVVKMLRGINEEKREYNRARGKGSMTSSCHQVVKSWCAAT
jgi:hypothetical protein